MNHHIFSTINQLNFAIKVYIQNFEIHYAGKGFQNDIGNFLKISAKGDI